MKAVDRADRFQRRHPALGYPIGVIYKFVDDQGAYLAALITYYGFLSIFPLLLLLQSVLGFFIENNDSLRRQILDSVLTQIPVLGNSLQNAAPGALKGSVSAIIVGSIVALYGGLGVAQAIQHTSNTCWAVPRNRRPNPILMRLRSAAVLLFLGSALIGVGLLPRLWPPLASWSLVINIVIGTGVFLLLMKMTTARGQGWGRLAPGAVFISIVWQLFVANSQEFTAVFGARSSDTYGTYGGILTLLLASFILSLAFVLGTEINVVLHKHLYPRSLLTEFTDDVDLTLADQEAYAALARMQRFKEYEYIDVLFDKNGDGVADAPSDLHARWEDAKTNHEEWVQRGHPDRPGGTWGVFESEQEARDAGSQDGATALDEVEDAVHAVDSAHPAVRSDVTQVMRSGEDGRFDEDRARRRGAPGGVDPHEAVTEAIDLREGRGEARTGR